jgi:hypothetical protein
VNKSGAALAKTGAGILQGGLECSLRTLGTHTDHRKCAIELDCNSDGIEGTDLVKNIYACIPFSEVAQSIP